MGFVVNLIIQMLKIRILRQVNLVGFLQSLFVECLGIVIRAEVLC